MHFILIWFLVLMLKIHLGVEWGVQSSILGFFKGRWFVLAWYELLRGHWVKLLLELLHSIHTSISLLWHRWKLRHIALHLWLLWIIASALHVLLEFIILVLKLHDLSFIDLLGLDEVLDLLLVLH